MDLYVRILHAKRLSMRKVNCDDLMKRMYQASSTGIFRSVNIAYVETHDPDNLRVPDLKSLVRLEKVPNHPEYDGYVKNLHLSQVSNVLKHYQAIKDFYSIIQNAATANTPINPSQAAFIILEDDVLFRDTIADSLSTAIKKANEQSNPYDICMLDLPSLTFGKDMPGAAEATPTQPIFIPHASKDSKDTKDILPTCAAYMLSKEAIEKIATVKTVANPDGTMAQEDGFFPIRFIYNVQLSYLIKRHALRVATITPNLFADGSKYGIYISSLSSNNPLILSIEYLKLQEYVRSPKPYTQDDLTAITAIYDSIRYKTHPDMMLLFAMHELKLKNYQNANTICKDIYMLLTTHHGFINSESEFLKFYMALHKYLQ